MATRNWLNPGTNGDWNDENNWSPSGVPGPGDDVVLGSSGSSYTVTLSTAASVTSVTVQDSATLILTNGNSLSTSSGIILDTNSYLGGAGTVTANGGISGTGTLEAGTSTTGGILDVFGTISSGVVLAIGAAAATTLKIEGIATSATPISINNSNQTLEIGSAGDLTINAYQAINNGHIVLDGGTLNDLNGLFLDGSSTLFGHGVVLTGTGNTFGGTGLFVTYTPTITASGGVLDLVGTTIVATGGPHNVFIDTAPGSTLKIDGTAKMDSISINDVNQTLEIGSSGALTLFGDESITNGQIKLDGGTLGFDSSFPFSLTVGSGATLSGFGAITGFTQGTGTIIASGGTLEFKSEVDVVSASAFHIAAGSTLKFDAAVGTSTYQPTITFDDATGTLDLSGLNNETHNFYGQVSGFQAGDQIKIASGGIGPESYTASFDGTCTTLTFVDGDVTVDGIVKLVGDYTGAHFVINDNGVIDTITTDAICFMAGTLIRTPEGMVAVETLKRGDLVVTSDGHVKPVSWLGLQAICSRFADPLRVWPIRIKAGALGESVPSRDLLLSPDHAILVDGALIQAGALVNSTSILRETNVPDRFTYYHVELEDHSLILAENTPAETFVDNVDRLNFDNWAEHQALYPNGKAIEELPYPRAKSQRQVPVAIRVKLGERAQAIGVAFGVAAA